MDFPAWLGNNTSPEDIVIMHMDLDAERQFDILQSLLLTNRLALVDYLYVRWHYQAEVNFTTSFAVVVAAAVATLTDEIWCCDCHSCLL